MGGICVDGRGGDGSCICDPGLSFLYFKKEFLYNVSNLIIKEFSGDRCENCATNR